MHRNLYNLIVALTFILLAAVPSLALTVTFSDTISNPLHSGWTHTLDLSDFTPEISSDDIIVITSANLEIVMDYQRDRTSDGASVKLFQVTATGDSTLIDTFTSTGHAGAVNNELWLIDLTAITNADAVLQALKDGIFAITLSVDAGNIKNIDYARLSGCATVRETDPPLSDRDDPRPIPEPCTIVLLGAGLAGLCSFVRRTRD